MNTFKHSGGFGDMIYGLPAVIALGGGTYIMQDHQRAVLGELFDRQPCIKEVVVLPFEEWQKVEVTHNLDTFRESNGDSIIRMHLDAFNLEFDLTQKWIFNIEANRIAPIVIFDTGRQRWPGHTVQWHVLRGYEDKCVFVGNDTDYEIFLHDRQLDIKRHKVPDLYEFTRVIAGADLYISNVSCVCASGEGLKVPRVVDQYIGKPQYPYGPDGYNELTKKIIDRYVK